MKIGLTIVIVFGVSLLSKAGELATQYDKLEKMIGKQPSASEDRPNGAWGISEIAIERGPCMGPSPAYIYKADSNGVVRYHGEANVTPLGDRTGRVPPHEFNRLAQFIRSAKYMGLANNYAEAATCQGTVYTRVNLNGQTKLIRNYGDAGPASLWAVEQLIDSLMRETSWDDVPKKDK